MRRLRIVGLTASAGAVVAAAVIVAGQQLATAPHATAAPDPTKPTATVSGVGEPTRLLLYQQSLGPAYDNMQSALQNIDNSLRKGDWDGAIDGCHELADSGAQFKALLPTPDQKLTSKVRQAAAEIANASNVCMNFGPSTTNADYNQMQSYVSKAIDNLVAAKGIMSPGG
ncbi:MAG TPA: hypothetical protein VH496_18460 [Mycobacterium sp.]